ncbi:MAG: OadG family protein, partial [Victivallales bacterium]|nr:OadG family protein [Victivallales bacterium]
MELLIDGFKLLVIGMGWVFLFLTLMILLMWVVSKVVAPYAHLLEKAPTAAKKKKPLATISEDAAMV